MKGVISSNPFEDQRFRGFFHVKNAAKAGERKRIDNRLAKLKSEDDLFQMYEPNGLSRVYIYLYLPKLEFSIILQLHYKYLSLMRF